MARLKVKLDPFDRDIQVFLSEALGPEARSKVIADTARRALAEAENQNRGALGRVPEHTTWVDGRQDAPLESVRPEGGEIVFEFQLFLDMFDWIAGMLEKHSPVGKADDPRPGHPGLYRRSHVLVADNVAVDDGQQPPLGAREYAFINTQPYARKLERGHSSQAPNGIYEVTAALAAARFGNVARIRFSYRSPLFGTVNQWAATTSLQSRKGHKGRAREDWLRRQPAVTVQPFGT